MKSGTFISISVLGTFVAMGCASKSGDQGTTTNGTPGVDAGNGHAGSGHDASVPPAGGDDAGQTIADAGDAGSACVPADESGFQPKWHPAKASPSCSQSQMDAYHQCLKDGQTQKSPASCAPFGTTATAGNKACVACILTQDSAAQYGAIVVHKGTLEMNVPGCLAIAANDPQGTGCAGKFQAASQCRNDACSANCPVTDNATFQAEQACEQSAAAGTCKGLQTAAACVDALVDAGGAAAQCLSGQTFDDLYTAIVPMFCGGAPIDAGGGG